MVRSMLREAGRWVLIHARSALRNEGAGMGQEQHRDNFGVIPHNPVTRILELEWLEGSREMTDEDFKRSMERYAVAAGRLKAELLLVDVTKFGHVPGPDVAGWRDAKIIPRHNDAGVVRFAFVVPQGTPGTAEQEAEPSEEAPGRFPTAYFEDRQRALEWLAAGL